MTDYQLLITKNGDGDTNYQLSTITYHLNKILNKLKNYGNKINLVGQTP